MQDLNSSVTESRQLSVVITPKFYGQIRVPIVFTFNIDGETCVVSREVLIKSVSNPAIFKKLEPSSPYKKTWTKRANDHKYIKSDSKPDIE